MDDGSWSKDFDKCIECDRTDRPHAVNGKCGTCAMRDSRKNKKAGFKRQPRNVVCACGIEFITNHPSKRHCSRICNTKNNFRIRAVKLKTNGIDIKLVEKRRAQGLIQPMEKSIPSMMKEYIRTNVKQREKKKGIIIEFDLTQEEFAELVFKNCHYCGATPNTIVRTGYLLRNGIDRVDSDKGYIKGNCVTCCGKCNKLKNILSIDDFLGHISKIYLWQNKDKKEN